MKLAAFKQGLKIIFLPLATLLVITYIYSNFHVNCFAMCSDIFRP